MLNRLIHCAKELKNVFLNKSIFEFHEKFVSFVKTKAKSGHIKSLLEHFRVLYKVESKHTKHLDFFQNIS